VASGLGVAGSDGAELLESDKEVLDQVMGFLQVALMAALVLARTDQRNHHDLVGLHQGSKISRHVNR